MTNSKGLLRWGSALGRGLLKSQAPSVAAGGLVKFLRDKEVNAAIVADWAQRDVSLWEKLPPQYRVYLKKLAKTIGYIDWLTADWFINAVMKEKPAIATLFINWPEGMDWLRRQAEDIKTQLVS